MDRRVLAAIVSLPFLVAALTAAPAARAGSHVEHFESWSHRDATHTTARWDTTAGELTLPPRDLTLETTLDTPGFSFHVALQGTLACLADGEFGLLTFERVDPDSPVFLGAAPTPGLAQAVAISGSRAFVADSHAGLMIFDVSEPSTPALLGSAATPVRSRSVKISGSVAWVTYSDGAVSGLQAFDIGDPAAPIARGAATVPGHAYGLDLSENLAYVAAADAGLRILDISDPDAPALRGGIDTDGFAYDVQVRDGLAWIADHDRGLVIFDVGDPGFPIRVGGHETTGPAFGVALAGDFVYLAVGTSGLEVIGLDDSGDTFALGALDPGDRLARGLAVEDDRAYLASGEDGLHVISTPNPWYDAGANLARSLPLPTSGDWIVRARLTTAQSGTIDWEISADGGEHWEPISTGGSWIAMSSPGDQLIWRSELTIDAHGLSPRIQEATVEWEVDAPTGAEAAGSSVGGHLPRLRAGRPNPFTSQVRIEYELPRHTRVTLEVFDATGRRIDTLVGGGAGASRRAGRHEALWFGRDEKGLRVTAGVYFVRLRTTEGTEMRKILRVR